MSINTNMKIHCALLLLFFAVSACTASKSNLDGNVLFNGKNLSGWDGDQQYWRVEDGMIVGEFSDIQHNQFLRSKAVVDNFRLTLNVKIVDGQGNSGIQFRSTALPGGTFEVHRQI